MRLPFDSAILLLRIYPGEMKTSKLKLSHTHMNTKKSVYTCSSQHYSSEPKIRSKPNVHQLIERQNVVYPNKEIIFINQKNQILIYDTI